MKNLLQQPIANIRKSLIIMAYLLFLSALPASAQVWTYDFPGGEQFSSPDYKVTIEQADLKYPSFVHYSYGLDEYQKYIVNNSNLLPSGAPVTFNNRGTESHSAAKFSFSGTIKVIVTIKKNAKHISLPLKSAKILPSSYNIPCQIINDSTITFTLDRPEKLAVMANYDQAWSVFEQRAIGHIPIQNWESDFNTEISKTSYHGNNLLPSFIECYKNPLFILALPPETNVPAKTAAGTLVVNPGDVITQTLLDQYQTVWFAPGIHDLSRMGSTPRYQVIVNPGQTIYLEGGSYVFARFRKNSTTGKVALKGRGVVSGSKHHWSSSLGAHISHIDTIIGITLTDREAFGVDNSHYIKDVTLLGGWHGNTDGLDFSDDCVIQNCFLQAFDDNLKLNNNTHAKHVVIWQMENAHSIMVKEMRDDITFANCIVEDVDILANLRPVYGDQWSRLNGACLASCNGRNIQINNFIFRDIRIESPYINRVFSFFNLDTNQPYAASWLANAPSSEARHTRINGIIFENITVTSPLILERSLLGSDYSNSMSNLSFINININGTVVNEENKDVYFEIEYPKISGLSFSPNSVEKVTPEAFSIHPNPVKDIVTLFAKNGVNNKQAYLIYDLTGRLMDSGRITANETAISIGKLECGTYILNVTDNHMNVMSFKFLKE
jgi:hypothetical protein